MSSAARSTELKQLNKVIPSGATSKKKLLCAQSAAVGGGIIFKSKSKSTDRGAWMSANGDAALSADVKAIFERLTELLDSDQRQNDTLPEPYRSAVVGGINCDVLPGAKGEFGRAVTNPIPVNGPLGEILYLSRLRTNSGWRQLWSSSSPIMFHRVRAEDGLVGAVDVFEVLSIDGKIHEELFLSLYHPRKSNRTPTGYVLAPKLDSANFTYGVNHIVEQFPQKLDAYIRKWQMEMLGIPLPVHRVREAVNGSRFKPSFLDDFEKTKPDQLGAQVREDFQRLLHAINDPRFEGQALAIGIDGVMRPFSEEPPPLPAQNRFTEQSNIKPRIFQTHNYGGKTPIDQWALARLQIICIQSVHAIRVEAQSQAQSLGAILSPGYWYECIYLAYFLLTVALMKTEFGGNPTSWADGVAKGTLKKLLAVRFEQESFPEIVADEAVQAYQLRYAQYWSHLGALTTDATNSELTLYAIHLARIFTGESNVLLGFELLALANAIVSQIATSVEALGATTDRLKTKRQ